MAGPTGLPTHLRLLDPLGAGGAGTVWRARDTRRGRDVALKLFERVADGPAAAVRLEREVRALGRLHDVDGVVSILECGLTEQGTAWAATKLLPGGSLEQRLRSGPFTIEVLAALGASLATTLARVHDAGIAHGDLTPSNVLFDARDRPVLADLGLAWLDGEVGGAGCTPAYSPPERLRGSPPSAAADVWSLAATLKAAAPPGERLPEVLEACRAERPSQRPSAARVAAELAEPGPRRARRSDRFRRPGRGRSRPR